MGDADCWPLAGRDEAARALAASEVDLVRAALSWIRLFDGRCSAAAKVSREVLANPGRDPQATIWAAMAGAAAAGLRGSLREALTTAGLGRSVALAHADRLPWGRAQVELGRCLAMLAAGRIDGVARIAAAGHRLALLTEAAAMAGLWAAVRGVAAKAQGCPAEALAALREAMALLDDTDPYRLMPVCLAEAAGAAALAGDVAAAEELMARADARRDGTNRLFQAWIERNRAWVEAAGGALTPAAGTALEAAGLAQDTEQPTIEALCLYDAARFGAAGVRSRLAHLASAAEGAFLPALASAAAGLAGGDAAALGKAAEVFADHGHRLLAAEAATVAAVGHRRGGLHVRARFAAERAATLAQACAGAQTVLLCSAHLVAALTPREREVALLAASLPSRQVADRLGLSVHTVNNNLARAFTKLGVAGRAELARLLRDPDGSRTAL